MKKLTKFLLISFIGPFVLTFFISVFVLLMQFIWLWVDEMLGKGIEWYIIAEFLMYSAANIVPLALPLAVLLASIMTFGNLGEHFELVSFKSAGISLQRIMRPLAIFVMGISIGAFLFSNYIIPVANLKFYSLLHDIRNKKPAVNIKQGVFYNEIEGYTIRVMKKDKLENGDEMLRDVMIYTHKNIVGNRKLTVADSAIMKMSDDKKYFSINLFNGVDYQDQTENRTNKIYPFSRFSFEENAIRISLDGFSFSRTDEDAFKHDYRLFNLKQLENKIDTLVRENKEHIIDFTNLIKSNYLFNDTIFSRNKNKGETGLLRTDFISELNDSEIEQLYSIAINNVRSNKGRASASATQTVVKNRDIARMNVEWHRKYSFSLACFIMFLIGAPLGAIVKKGGLGMPVVISVAFFVVFWITSIVGEKMVKEMVVLPYQGMWMSTAFLLPLGLFFTYKATTDSEMFNFTAYVSFFSKLFKKKEVK
ncbi:MAG: LptF/LptG family permease [Flavobacteriales bacterium]|nr:LptF/LptG family permease [Flavobacteriales bacterium]